MKTNRVLIITVAVACFAATAHAYFDPTIGRWANRDPINEPGHKLLRADRRPFISREEVALYRFTANDPVNRVDSDGLFVLAVPYAYGCPAFPSGDLFVCKGVKKVSGLCPKNPLKLAACIKSAQDAMNYACLMDNYLWFSDACYAINYCLSVYW